MFGLFKKKMNTPIKKNFSLVSVVDGTIMPLSEVPDPVFAEKIAGDGVAINPTSNTILAPADGKVSLIFKTKHAFAMTLDNGVEILVHIGLDTVSLNGYGFEALIDEGSTVKAGTPIIKIDSDFIISKGLSLITPILITNTDITSDISINSQSTNVIAGDTKVISYTIK